MKLQTTYSPMEARFRSSSYEEVDWDGSSPEAGCVNRCFIQASFYKKNRTATSHQKAEPEFHLWLLPEQKLNAQINRRYTVNNEKCKRKLTLSGYVDSCVVRGIANKNHFRKGISSWHRKGSQVPRSTPETLCFRTVYGTWKTASSKLVINAVCHRLPSSSCHFGLVQAF